MIRSIPGERPLTPREAEILALTCAGMRGQEVAKQLSLTLWTVKQYKTSIMGKLGVSTFTHACYLYGVAMSGRGRE